MKSKLSQLFNEIQKAHNIGDHHPSKPWVWAEYKPGKFDWRGENTAAGKAALAKRGGGGGAPQGGQAPEQNQPQGQASTQQPTGQPATQPKAQPQAQPAAAKPSATPRAKSTGGSTYKVPTPKIKYSFLPKTHLTVPSSFKIRSKKDGSIKDVDTSKQLASMMKLKDDDLIKLVNNTKNNKVWVRQIALDAAAARGIPEDKLDVSGTLQDKWDQEAQRQALLGDDDDEDSDDESEVDYSPWLDRVNVEEIDKQFPEGDEGWNNPDDKRIKQAFNLKTMTGRQDYDAYRDYKKQQDPFYDTPEEVMQNLRTQYLGFIEGRMGPLFIATGGAGVGKTWSFDAVAKLDSLEEGEDYVKLGNPKSDSDFLKTLKANNGKILVFDDADDIIKNKRYQPLMKTLNDGNPSDRIFPDPDDRSKSIKWTGRIIVLSNKNTTNLIKEGGEDVKAIFSRAQKTDIDFTVRENLEKLGEQYQYQKIDGIEDLPKAKEQKLRKDVYNYLVALQDRIDPATFTVRKFSELCGKVVSEWIREDRSAKSKEASKLLGKGKGWQRTILRELNKGFDDVFEKAEDNDNINPADGLTAEGRKTVEELKKEFKKNKKFKKLYDKNFGRDEAEHEDDGNDDDEESDTEEQEKAEKALDCGELSLSEAEELLFK